MFGPKVDSDVDVDHRPVINVNVTIEGNLEIHLNAGIGKVDDDEGEDK